MKSPDFWNYRSGPEAKRALRTVLRPLGWLYAKAAAHRFETTQPLDPGVPIICVGNATLGGTGKTPVVAYLLKSMRRLGVQAHGLSRGYGGREKGPTAVGPKHSAQDVGDEPILLSRHGPMWVAAGRDEGAMTAVSNGAKVIIMDDGHQNPSLVKTLSFLVVDAEVGFGNGCVFPAGPLRENLEAAQAQMSSKPKALPIIINIRTPILRVSSYSLLKWMQGSLRQKKIMSACRKATGKACKFGLSPPSSKMN